MYDPPKQVRAIKGIKDCCLDSNNLVREYVADDKVTDTCQVCGCRHRRMFAEPLDLLADMKSVQFTKGQEPQDSLPPSYQFNI